MGLVGLLEPGGRLLHHGEAQGRGSACASALGPLLREPDGAAGRELSGQETACQEDLGVSEATFLPFSL